MTTEKVTAENVDTFLSKVLSLENDGSNEYGHVILQVKAVLSKVNFKALEKA